MHYGGFQLGVWISRWSTDALQKHRQPHRSVSGVGELFWGCRDAMARLMLQGPYSRRSAGQHPYTQLTKKDHRNRRRMIYIVVYQVGICDSGWRRHSALNVSATYAALAHNPRH